MLNPEPMKPSGVEYIARIPELTVAPNNLPAIAAEAALGDLTSSYPAFKRNGTGIAFRLGDDSGPASISVRSISGRSGAGAPSTSDISAGEFIVWKNTVDATVKLYYNDAGTLKSSVLN